ncbi:MAG: carbon-phosphorus lyase complex subunit PhnI [Chloroflexota bacterium]|nr:carbon-phosphorus lyase complex subunit PhnI [Chloroflexota bacterium]
MAYVATRGGEEAIQRAEQLYRALDGPFSAEFVRAVEQHLPYLVDRVMGEGSLYAPALAALALVQTGGDLYEAVLLLRAYRSTLPRLAYAEPLSSEALLTVRRISAAFKDIPGGQILGPTLDYSHRILHTEILDDENCKPAPAPELAETPAPADYPPVSGWQRLNGLLDDLPEREPANPADLPDVTREPVTFPSPREHRLQSLARADTGGVLTLGYAGMRGYGLTHPTVNEVKLAYADVQLRHPVTGVAFSAGRIRISQTEVVSTNADELELGFAATMGWNEVKTIAGATLDMEMNKPTPHPAHTDEFVLYHTEPVESSGFCIHFKLPHYVTFSSSLDAIRRVRARHEKETDGDRIQQLVLSAVEEAVT